MPIKRLARRRLTSGAVVLAMKLTRIRGLAHDLSLELARASGRLSVTSALTAEIEREADAALQALKYDR
jgi:hypothetical protein